ncbi:MAG: carboxy-S-adenosyl-L-methionine synthase CmoA [Gammaproteobacteria bacterium]|nr:carboxy-S-adenosyl-L-methionine synthase CmoA [Gammaproteobacteria bacterium]
MAEKITKIKFGVDTDADVAGNDKLFAAVQAAHDFNFGTETAMVFDDMVSRSVPFYDEIQRMTCEIAASFAVPETNLYDIGCATGTTLLALDQVINPAVHLIGMDNSSEMLARAKIKLAKPNTRRKIHLVNTDMNDPPQIENASVVIMLLTLQFVRPLNRACLIKEILNGLRDDGCLILVEKVTGTCTMLNRLFIEYYYNYKRRNGYSDLEIAQKREALENVLIPYHNEENRDLLLNAGFQHIEEFFRWYNFSGLIAVK